MKTFIIAELSANHNGNLQIAIETIKAIGEVSYELTDKQKKGKQFARSLYVAEDMKEGDVIREENVRSVRPDYGMHPKYLKGLLGKRLKKDLVKGTALSTNFILQETF